MRKTVAKRIRKYAARNGYTTRVQIHELKRIWNKSKWSDRFQLGKEME